VNFHGFKAFLYLGFTWSWKTEISENSEIVIFSPGKVNLKPFIKLGKVCNVYTFFLVILGSKCHWLEITPHE